MRDFFEDALVTGYRDLESSLTCDPKDRHVLAAAVRANAAILVTFNLKDFPRRSTDDFDIDVVHPDEFLLDQYGLFEETVVRILHEQAESYDDPEMTVYELLSWLEKSGVPNFARCMREIIEHQDTP